MTQVSAALRIAPQEIQRLEHRNHVTVRTKIPKDLIDDKGLPLIPHLRRSGLSAGDMILVQCLTYDGILLSQADFVVCEVRETSRVVADGERDMTVKDIYYRVARCSEWWDAPGSGAAQALSTPSAQPAPAVKPDKAKVAA